MTGIGLRAGEPRSEVTTAAVTKKDRSADRRRRSRCNGLGVSDPFVKVESRGEQRMSESSALRLRQGGREAARTLSTLFHPAFQTP